MRLIRTLSYGISFQLLIFCIVPAIAQPIQQNKLSGNAAEQLWALQETKWEIEMQKTLHISRTDFQRFLSNNPFQLQKAKGRFFYEISKNILNTKNADTFFDELKSVFTPLYIRFEKNSQATIHISNSTISKHNNFLVTQSICNPSCDNIGFQNGTLSAWSAYYGINNSNTSFVISSLTGGAAGAVTQSANDPNIIPITPPNATSSYQVSLMQKTGLDTIAGALIPLAPPLGGICAMVGDGINTGQGVGQLEQTFSVSASNPVLTIQYAVVLENPNSHTYFEQPFFNMQVLDAAGNPIPSGCGNYSVVSGPGQAGYKAIYYAPSGDTAYCRPWATVLVPLYNYIGQCITVRFQAADCSLGAHFGYAYVACSCSNPNLNSTSSSFCAGQKSVTISGLQGAAAYKWTGPCISGPDSLQIIHATCPGTYQVIEKSLGGATCLDTMNIAIPASPNGPPPIPSFTATEACFGNPTQFTNTSNPLTGTGVRYYWDFYNSGQRNDSTQNPSWTYPQPGIFQVTLQETNNGCSSDTSITVKVDSTPTLFQTPVLQPIYPSDCNQCNGKITISVSNAGSNHTITNNLNTDIINAGGGSGNFMSNSNVQDSITYSITYDSMTVYYSGLCTGTYHFYINCPNPIPAGKCSAGEQKHDTLTVTLSCPASIFENSDKITVSIYPIPASTKFTIETNMTGNQLLQVYDVTGKQLLTQNIQTNKTAIDASCLAQGVYYMSLIGNEGRINKRIVIVH